MKKNFKRILAMILVVVMSCSSVVSAFAETLPADYSLESVATDETVTTDETSQDANSVSEEPAEEAGSGGDETQVPADTPSEGESAGNSDIAGEGDKGEAADSADSTVDADASEPSESGTDTDEPAVSDSEVTDDMDGTTAEDSEPAEDADAPEDDGENLDEEEIPGEDDTPFVPLEIADSSSVFDAEIGDTVELFVKLNRDDVNVHYQWQKRVLKDMSEDADLDESEEDHAEYDGDGNNLSASGYLWVLADMTEAEWLAQNPEGTWQGKWLWDEAVELADGDASRVHIPRGATSLADVTIDGMEIVSDEMGDSDVEATEDAQVYNWVDLDGETNASYLHVADADDNDALYRCVVTIDDEAYFAAAAADAKANTAAETEDITPVESDETETEASDEEADADADDESGMQTGMLVMGDTVIYDGVVIAATATSESMSVHVPEEADTIELFSMMTSMLRSAPNRNTAPNVTFDGQFLVGVDRQMEYITKDTYDLYGCSNANNAYWTSLSDKGGTRPDGSTYMMMTIASGGKLPVLSAWYGKTVYVRYRGGEGTGTAIQIPAYTGVNYQTGEKTMYKDAITVLDCRVTIGTVGNSPDFYRSYWQTIANPNTGKVFGTDNAYILLRMAPMDDHEGALATCFNTDPERYLKDAEGNYCVDSVMVGVNVTSPEPDLSGKAAWALEEFINEGYGFMTGHDMLYCYKGIEGIEKAPGYDANTRTYTPDRNSTTTPYYHYYADELGHYNVAWLIGSNKNYTDANPYEARSMVLCAGGDPYHKHMNGTGYEGDGYDTGVKDTYVRVTKVVEGNPLLDVNSRVPTNYPFNTSNNGDMWKLDTEIKIKASHTNNQIAFGNIWFDFVRNTMTDLGESGKIITDTINGLTGTTNFYLTTNGNIAMNQIGHMTRGQIGMNEGRIFANTIMYISQRQQCQVCQSQQGGNDTVHFVHRIYSAEQLANLNNPDLWYTYPTRNCYMLSADITLPEDWEPIRNFDGHFHADGHTVTLNSKGTPLFANDSGTMDQHASGTTTGWNIGTDSTKGLDKVTDNNGNRTTGIARVSGYLASLFSTGMNVDWSNCKVVVHGTDGKDYTCYTNVDGKYVISNVPCTGIMKANVYDANGRDITEYGPIRVNVPEKFWNTDETTPLYLIGFTAMPVVDQTVYEGQTAIMAEGGVYYNSKVTDIVWQYRVNASSGWKDISSTDIFDYEISAPEFHDLGDDSYTLTTLTIKSCQEKWTGYQFRAVFKANGRTTDTFAVREGGKTGKLTVLARPMYVSDPAPQTIWIDSNATFTSTCEAVVGSDNGLKVQWQVRRNFMDTWMNIESFPGLNDGVTSQSVTNTTSAGTIDPDICPVKTTSTLNINCAAAGLDNYQFRAVYSYTVPETGALRTKASSDGAAYLTVKTPSIDVAWVEGQEERVGVSFENPVICELGSETTGGNAVVYEGDITYIPGPDETDAGTPKTDIVWRYHTATQLMPVTWNQASATALAQRLGVVAPTVTMENGTPVKQADGTYKIHVKMTISNISWKFYSDDCMLWFSVGATNHYKTHPYQAVSCESTYMPLIVDFKVDIKWNQGVHDYTPEKSTWTYPEMTVNSAAGVKTLLLYFDTSVEPNYDRTDRFNLEGLPVGMRVAISNPHYVMLVADGEPISDKELEQYLRNNLSVYVYDSGPNRVQPKLRAYINAEQNLGGVAQPSGSNVNFYASGNGVIKDGDTASYVNVGFNEQIVVPRVVPDYGYEFVCWADQRGNVASFKPGDTISVTKGASYTATFRVTNDADGNGFPDDCEATLTVKVANGMFLSSTGEMVTQMTKQIALYDENGKFSPTGTSKVIVSLLGEVMPNEGYIADAWVGSGNVKDIDGSVVTIGAGASTITNTCVKMIYVSWTDLNNNVNHQIRIPETQGYESEYPQILSPNGHWGDAIVDPTTQNVVIPWVQDKVVVTWKDASGTTLQTATVDEGSDYSAQYPDDQSADGYWGDPVRTVSADGTRSTLTITWKNGTRTLSMSDANISMMSLDMADEAESAEESIVFPETKLVTLMFVAGNGGHLEGQTVYRGAPGMTWDDLGVIIPTPVADEPFESLDGMITEYSFNEADTWLPAEADRVLTGEDGDVIVVRANFDSNTYEKEVVVPYEETFEKITQKLRTSPAARAYSANVSIAWRDEFMAEGDDNVAIASQEAPYMQWQVSDDDGAHWNDCIGETNSLLIIGRLWGNMGGWKYRLKYGNSESDFKYSNEITIMFAFEVDIGFKSDGSDRIHVEFGSGQNFLSMSDRITLADYLPNENSRITRMVVTSRADIGYDFDIAGHEGDCFYGIFTNKDGLPEGNIPIGANKQVVLQFWHVANQTGGLVTQYRGTQPVQVKELGEEYLGDGKIEWIRGFIGNAASSLTYKYHKLDVTVHLEGVSVSTGEGVPIRRNDHEAWDLTTVYHDKVGAPDVVAEITAYDKVYDGTETIATVTLTDRNQILSPSELNKIAANGTIKYSTGATTSGTAKSGSLCVDVGPYTATFIPASGDMQYFASNTPDDIAKRDTTFQITQRPINLYSYNNDREYNGNDSVTVKNIQMEAFNASNVTGIIPADAGKVSLNTTTFVGSFNEVKHQTNGQQVQITRPEGVSLFLTGTKALNYCIGREDYTGAISPRPLYLHSTYHDETTYTYTYDGVVGTRHDTSIVRYNSDKTVQPNNVKEYDNTTSAIINNIAVDNLIEGEAVWIDQDEDNHAKGYNGTYADYNAGEKLDEKGRVLPDHLNKLTEVSITRSEPIALVNNDHGDYYIASETYTGAIYRALLTVDIASKNSLYGEEPSFTLTYAKKYTSTNSGSSSDVTIGPLRGKDVLTIDSKLSKFVLSRVIDKNTPAGAYPIEFTGVNETNYPVLSNYIVANEGGNVIVSPRQLVVTVAGGYEKYYGDQLPEFGVEITGWADNGDNVANSLAGTLKFNTLCKWDSDVRYLPDGTTIVPYTVSAYGLEVKYNENGWQNYDITYVDGDIKVLPLPVTIRAIEKSKVYGYADPALGYTMSTARVKESDLQFSLSRLKGEDVGQYDMIFDETRITDLDRGNYDITFVPAKLTITPRTLMIDAYDHQRYYGEENPEFDVRYIGFAMGDTKETALENTLEIKCAATKTSPVGSYNIGLSGETVKENSNGLYNYEIAYTDGSLLVKPRPITIIADDQIKYVGEDDPELTWHLADGDEIVDPEGAPLHVELVRQPGEKAFGTYPIYSDKEELDNGHDTDCACELQSKNTNYVVKYVPGTLTILDETPALVLKVGDATMVYGEDEPVDDYRLIWYMDETGKHDIPEGTDVRDFFDLKLAGDLTFEADGTDPRDVGVYDINGTGLESGKYEQVLIIPGNLTVTPRPVILTPQDKTKVYGDPDPELTYSITDEITGIIYEDGNDPAARVKEGDLQGTLARRPGEDVGKYLIRVGTLGDDPNYTITLDRAHLTITPAELIVTVWNHDDPEGKFHRVYGEENPEFDIRIDGFKNGDSIVDLAGHPEYQTEADKTSSMGEYPVTVDGFSNENYNIHYVPGILEVEPMDITIVIDSTTKVYGDEDPEFTWHLPEGTPPVDEDSITGDPSRTPGEDVGGYPIGGEFESDDPNIGKITVIPGILTITPAKLVVKAEDKTKVYGDENPEWTSVADGLKNGDTLDDLDGELTYSVKEHDGKTDVSRTTDVGTYPINISENSTLESKNYVIEYEDATLTITKRPIDITPGDPDKPERSLTIEKFADKAVAQVGDTINYKLVVTNTGSVELTNVPVVDNNDGAGSIKAKDGHGYTYEGGSRFLVARLPAGESVTITYSYVVVAEDAGKDITNVAIATIPGTPAVPGDPDDPTDPGKPEEPPVDVPSNEVTIPVDPTRDVTIVKSADKEVAKVGEAINYTLHVTNTGNTALTNLVVRDELATSGNANVLVNSGYGFENDAFVIYSLAAGESIDLLYSYVPQLSDAGKVVHNVAIVSVPTTPENPIRGLKVEKSADREDAKVGDTINYTLVVTNTGNVELENVPVTDTNDGAGSITAKDGHGYTYEGGSSFLIARLPAGESVEIHYSYKVVAEDAGKTVKNVAVATIPGQPGTPGDPDDPTDPGKPEEPPVDVPSNEVEVPVDPIRGLSVLKEADKETVSVGDVIGYTITVTNTGTEDMHDLTVHDGMNNASGSIEATSGIGYVYSGNGEFLIPALNAGESVTIRYAYTAQVEDAGKTLVNVAVVNVPGDPDDPDDPGKDVPSNEVDVPVKEIRDLTIVKRADKAFAKVGETITYVLDVTNTGNVDLTEITVRDNNDGKGNIKAESGEGYTYVGGSEFVIAELKVGETVSISYTYTTVRADDGNTVTNVAVATIPGTPEVPGNPDDPNDPGMPAQPPKDIPSNEVEIPVKDPTEEIPSNPVDVPVTNLRDLSITKRSDIAFAKVGETITYTVDVTNTGLADLSDIIVRDTTNAAGKIAAADGEGYSVAEDGSFVIPELSAGQTVSIVYTYVAQEEDAGKTIENVAVATIPGNPDDPDDPGKDVPSNEVDVPVEPEKTPITIIPDPYVKVYGDPDPALTYKISEPLVKPDDVWGNVERDPGEDVGTYPINRGTVDSDNYEITFIPGTFEIIPAPLVIKANDETRMVGEPNPEFSVTYKGFKFDDGPEDLDGKLSIVTPADKESPVGKYPITPSGLTSSNYDITYVDGVLTVYDTSNLLVEKTADKNEIKVGETVTYTVTVSNLGTRAFTALRVKDTLKATGTINAADGAGYKYLGNGEFEIASLKAGEKVVITYTYTALADDLGTVLENIAVAKTPDGDIPTDKVEVDVPDKTRDLTIVKSANVDSAKVGDRITYTLLVTNTGKVELNDVVVKDTSSGMGGTIAQSGTGYTYDGNMSFTIARLGVGESITITYDYIVAEADAGTTIENVAVAKIPTIPAVPGDPDNPDDPGTPEVPGKDVPSNKVEVPVDDPVRTVEIEKTANKASAKVGDTVIYTISVKNTGNVAIQNVTVKDNFNGWGEITAKDGAGYTFDSITGAKARELHFTITSLAAGETLNIRYEYVVSEYDAGETVTNVAVAKVPGDPKDPDDPDKEIPSDPVDVPVDPMVRDLSIVKSANKATAKVGDVIVYTLTVKNTGNVGLTNITVKDTNKGYGVTTPNYGVGYEYDEKTDTYTIASLAVGESINITYSYTVVEKDAGKTVENVAVAKIPTIPAQPGDPNDPTDPGKPEIPGKDVPSNEVDIPVKELISDLSIIKSANVDKAHAGDTITYTITVKNTGDVALENVTIRDALDGKGTVNAASGKGYTYNGDMKFTIAKLAVGETVNITYEYVVADADVNSTVKNVAIASIPTIPSTPGNPDDPDDPGTPEIPGKDVPSNEVKVPVEPKPVTPPVIVTNNPNPATGIDFMSGSTMLLMAIMLFALVVIIVLANKRKPRV